MLEQSISYAFEVIQGTTLVTWIGLVLASVTAGGLMALVYYVRRADRLW